MPHATMPATGFQAVILCGSGESLNPFNSNPKDFPKALIPIANRPMVWYPLDWCYRMGVTNITVITPSICFSALSNALSQNPHLTSLPAPRPTLLAPESLTLTTGTAELFRLKEVQDVIENDFIILPCDLVCEPSGVSFLETWMTMQGELGGGVTDGETVSSANALSIKGVATGMLAEKGGRRGGLGVWYHTKDPETGASNFGIKNEETDFIASTAATAPVVPPPKGSLRPHVRRIALSMPTSELKDELEDSNSLRVRHALVEKQGMVKMQTSCRDAHVYFFPLWVKELLWRNETFESLGDVLGWWAKATWQEGLAEKLGLDTIFDATETHGTGNTPAELDIAQLTTTAVARPTRDPVQVQSENSDSKHSSKKHHKERIFAPQLLGYIRPPVSQISGSESSTDSGAKGKTKSTPQAKATPEPPAQPAPFLRRVDTVPLLLAASLHLANLPALDSHPSQPSPFAVPSKKPASSPLPSQSSIHTSNVLLDSNITLSPKLTLSQCVIGANCNIGSGVRISRSVLMEGVIIEDGVKLDGCVLGRRCKIEKGSELRDCYVQEGFVVSGETSSKGEIFAGFEGPGIEDDLPEDDAKMGNTLETV